MKAYWINLEKSVDRYEYMTKQFNEMGMDNERFNAITPDGISEVLISPEKCNAKPNELACLSSHLRAIEKAVSSLSSENEWVMVMEDDIKYLYKLDYNKIIESVPKDAEIIQLAVMNPYVLHEMRGSFLSGKTWVRHRRHHWSAGAYLVSRKTLESLRKNRYDGHRYDFTDVKVECIADIVLFFTCKTYTLTHPLFGFRPELVSTLHPEIEKYLKLTNHTVERLNKQYKKHPFILEPV